MRLLTERARWRVADTMDRLPGQCSTSLTSWALGPVRGDGRLPWRPITDLCRQDAAALGGHCWCGKATVTTTSEVPSGEE